MKLRNGFVSNSSSSSFVIGLSDISAKQLKLIVSHSIKGKLFDIPYGDTCPWNIEVTEDYVHGHTCMDNFDMREFLEAIGVDTSRVCWNHS